MFRDKSLDGETYFFFFFTLFLYIFIIILVSIFFFGNADFRSWSCENTYALMKCNNFCYGLNGCKHAVQICLGQDRIPLSWGPNDSGNKKKRPGVALSRVLASVQALPSFSQGIYSLEVCGGKSRAAGSYGDGWRVPFTPSGESWTHWV